MHDTRDVQCTVLYITHVMFTPQYSKLHMWFSHILHTPMLPPPPPVFYITHLMFSPPYPALHIWCSDHHILLFTCDVQITVLYITHVMFRSTYCGLHIWCSEPPYFALHTWCSDNSILQHMWCWDHIILHNTRDAQTTVFWMFRPRYSALHD